MPHSNSQAQVAGAIAILEEVTQHDAIHERNAAKRVLTEVMLAWPGNIERMWWKWVSEACNSLGLRTKTFDCTVDQVCSLARNHTAFTCFRKNSETGACEWMAVLSTSRNRFKTLLPGESMPRFLSKRQLAKAIKGFVSEHGVRVVTVHNAESSSSLDQEKGLTPIQRLGKLMRPEAGDIWIVLVFAFFVSLLMLATPVAVEALVNTVAFGRFLQPILVLALILLTFLGFQGAVRALQTYVVEIIQRKLFARVAGDLAYRLPRVEREATDREHLPELVNRFFDVVTVQKVAAQLLLDGIGLVLGTVIGMAVLGFYHPWLLGFDLFLLSSIALIIFVLGRGAVASAAKESKHKYYMAGWLEDIARCPTAFHNEGGSEFALERADRLIFNYLDARRLHFRIVMRQVIFALGLQAIASTVLLGLGGWLVVSGELTLGQLVAAELIVTVIVGSFAKFGKHMESFYDLLASVDKLGVLFDLPMEREDGILVSNRNEPCELKFTDVGYGWAGAPSVINNFTVKIQKGEKVAIYGGAGTGKSTLLDLIFGARHTDSGHLEIDGFDPRDLRPDVLRDRVALARGGEVFNATIEENVHLHRQGVTATEVRGALENVGLLEPVLRFQQGCETVLTSSGAPLSESQRRLLNVARAVVGRPGLLLIDGGLDTLNSEELDRCLAMLTNPDQPWTLLVATSRRDVADRLDRTISLVSKDFEHQELVLQD